MAQDNASAGFGLGAFFKDRKVVVTGASSGIGYDVALLDGDDALAELRALDGGALPGGSGADHGEIVLTHGGRFPWINPYDTASWGRSRLREDSFSVRSG